MVLRGIMSKALARIIVLLACLAPALAGCLPMPDGAGDAPPPDATEAAVTYVVDGDTIRALIGGQEYTIRYIGIDAPEMDDATAPSREIAEAATAANRRLVEGKTVRLVKDVSETDRYGRLLRYVYAGDLLVNAELVRLGQAVARSYPPDTRHHDLFVQMEEEARAAGIGVWAPAPAGTEQVAIVALNRDGYKSLTEPDEYVEFRNVSAAPVDMSGWRLLSERRRKDGSEVFLFPAGFVLGPGQACRIYTNEDHPEYCGLSFHSRVAIWHNSEPDAALLYDAADRLVSRFD